MLPFSILKKNRAPRPSVFLFGICYCNWYESIDALSLSRLFSHRTLGLAHAGFRFRCRLSRPHTAILAMFSSLAYADCGASLSEYVGQLSEYSAWAKE